MTDHPITPPPELRRLWAQQAQRMDPHDPVAWQQHVATQAARWGADQELEACCAWIPEHTPWDADKLRAARRPKPPTLVEQALALVEQYEDGCWRPSSKDWVVIRRALERLQELENNG